ncbi:uncharacterized protein LOC134699047 [Mytilus trossulus]|uniref:uncharacterized protein LOC134699047 n=1 Tax=Mytilus trossulus TaxID=6551 RepID=UPI00300555C6
MGSNKLYTLRKIYIALIRSKIDYGCEVYNTASASIKKILDKVQTQSLRLCTGSMKSASLKALQVEMGDPPYEIRRKALITKSFLNISTFENNHPAKKSIQDTATFEFYSKTVKRKPFTLIAKDTLKGNNFSENNVVIYRESPIPPWHFTVPIVNTYLKDYISKKDLPHLIKSEANIMIDTQYKHHLKIFTDGSKDPNSNAGCAFVIPELKINKGFKLNNHLSIFMCELTAIYLCISWLQDFLPFNVVIFVDSLSALQALKIPLNKIRNQFLLDIHFLLRSLYHSGTNIIFEWIPSHVGIQGNELADFHAKQALSFQNIYIFVPLFKDDFKTLCKNLMKKMWQEEWDKEKDRALYQISPKINFDIKIPKMSRYKERLIFKLRTGYIPLNKHLYKIGISDTKLCEECRVEETVEHFLLHCKLYNTERSILFDSLRKLQIQNFQLKNILTGYNFLPIDTYVKSTNRMIL